jgi:DpnII restriction endonuclease
VKEEIRQFLKGRLAATRALRAAMERTLSSQMETHWRFVGFRDYMVKYQDIARQVAKVIEISAPIGMWDVSKVKSSMDVVGLVQKQYFEAVYTNVLLLESFLEQEIGAKDDEIRALSDFFQVSLRQAVFDQPEREKHIQDVVEQLLIGRGLSRGVDYEREKGRVKVSIKETIPDFTIWRLGLAIEIKLCRDKEGSKSIIDEINADIQAYGKKYAALLFIVYDIGSIQNEVEYKQGIEAKERNIHVIIVKH